MQKFAWEENMSELFNATRCTSVDIVVGSDLLYDPTSFPSLVKLLVQLLTVGGAHTAYLACTQRNEKTLAMFDELLEVQEGITVVRTSLYSTDLKVNSSIRFCHIPSLEAARHRIILYKISFTRNNSS